MPDHWTYRDGVFVATGWHPRERGRKATVEPQPSKRGSLFERMSKAQRLEPQPVGQSRPAKRKPRAAPKRQRQRPVQPNLL